MNDKKLYELINELSMKLWGKDGDKSYRKVCDQISSPERDERLAAAETINMWLRANVNNRISQIWSGIVYPFPNDIGQGKTDATMTAADAEVAPIKELVEEIEFLVRELTKGV